MNPNIFREYDIRGRVPDELDRDTVFDLGRAIGTFYRNRGVGRISLGRDCRTSSPRIHEVFQAGLLETGTDVVDLDMIPTPLLYFSLFHLEVGGGVQITGSHNPPEYNGFKICLDKSTIYGQEIQGIRKILEGGDFAGGSGTQASKDIVGPYLDFLKDNIRPGPVRRKVVVDAGNGVGGPTATAAYERLGVSVEPLFCEPDGRFPNHHPDPTVPDNLKELVERVLASSADLGIGLDGDADRIGIVDHEGRVLFGDQLMIILSRDLLERNPGAKIIGEVKCSQVLFEDIKRHGGVPIMSKVGHSLIKDRMKEESALLAGEMSGHIFFKERYFGYDDAIYAGARVLEILTKRDLAVKDMLEGVPGMFNTPEIRMECPDEKKFRVVEALTEIFKRDHEVIDVDGARVLFDGGWGLVRASNTQPVLVFRFEASGKGRLEEIRALFMARFEDALKKT